MSWISHLTAVPLTWSAGVLGEKLGETDLAHKANEGIARHNELSQTLARVRGIEMPRVVSRENAKS
jgi:hypothetical protein